MASKDLILKLKVDSKSGQAAIKKVADQLKGLETAKGISAASDDMKKMGVNAAKAAEEYRKLIDASKADAERLKRLISLKKRAADADIRAIADASKADADRLRKSINAEKQLIAARNKSHSDAIRMEKQRLAAINKTHLFSMRMQKQRIAEINTAFNEAARMNKQHDKTNALLKNRVGIIGRIKKHLFAMRSYWLAISAAVSIAAISVVKFFKAGFMAVERFRLSVASVAASITTFSDLSAGDVDRVYANAVKYAGELALKMEIINVRTIATGEQLRSMNETFIQQGVLLDINNKEQEDSFVAVANAISLITQGQNQEIQMRQEVRGLLSGDIRATNLLARMIDTKLGGKLKENIILWKQQGTLLENLGKHLEGFAIASADLSRTWAALSTTFETIANRYLRAIFKPIYEDIIKSSLEFSRNLLSQKQVLGDTGKILRDELLTAWESTKSIVKGTFNILDGFKEPLLFMVKMVNMAVKGWALIYEHVTDIGLTMKEKFLTEEGVRSWIIPFLKSIGYEGDFIRATPLGEEPGKKDKVEKPELVPPGAGPSEEGVKKMEAWFTNWQRMEKENQQNLIKIRHEGYQQSVSLLMLEKQAMVDIYGEQEAINEHFQIKLTMLSKKEEDRAKKANEDAIKLREENQEKVLSYISTEMENKKRAIQQETQLYMNLTNSWEEQYAIREEGQMRLRALETEAAEKRIVDHEKVLQFISTEEENALRAIENERIARVALATTKAEINAINLAASEKASEVTQSAIQNWAKQANTAAERMKVFEGIAIQAAEAFSSGFTDAFFEFAEGTKSAGEAFKDFAASFLKQVAKMIIQALILMAIQVAIGAIAPGAGAAKPMSGVASGGTTGMRPTTPMMADGGIFSQGKMMKYAKGGIVNRPTIFPMAKGIGLMGESGPEAIMPLKRGRNGKLGLEGGGGSTLNTTINVSTGGEGEDPEASKRRGREMAKVIEAEFNKNLTKQLRPGGILNQN